MLEGENNLISNAALGNHEDFGLLYDHYVPKIYRFVFLKLASKSEAEDLTHDVFLTAWQNMPKFVLMGHPFSSWLYRIARNKVIDHWRAKKSTISAEDLRDTNQELESGERLDKNLETLMTVESAKNALAGLSDLQQDVILMRYMEDMEYGEIAKALNKSEGAIRVLQHRAVKELQKILKKDGN